MHKPFLFLVLYWSYRKFVVKSYVYMNRYHSTLLPWQWGDSLIAPVWSKHGEYEQNGPLQKHNNVWTSCKIHRMYQISSTIRYLIIGILLCRVYHRQLSWRHRLVSFQLYPDKGVVSTMYLNNIRNNFGCHIIPLNSLLGLGWICERGVTYPSLWCKYTL